MFLLLSYSLPFQDAAKVPGVVESVSLRHQKLPRAFWYFWGNVTNLGRTSKTWGTEEWWSQKPFMQTTAQWQGL